LARRSWAKARHHGQGARDLVAVGYDVIDLNFACPVPKVLRRGRGGALLAHPNTVIDIVKAVRGDRHLSPAGQASHRHRSRQRLPG
jgi:tRNA-dihydrouridine synthase